MGACCQRCADRRLVAESDKAALKLNLATNAQVFGHPLNKFTDEVKDPRSRAQRDEDPVLADGKIDTLISKNYIGEDNKQYSNQAEIGFVGEQGKGGQGSALLKRSDSRERFNLNGMPQDEWTTVEIIFALGHKRLTACRDDSVCMTFKDLATTPQEARWKFIVANGLQVSADAKAAEAENDSVLWHIESVAFPGKALTVSLAPQSVAKIAPLQMGSSDQTFRYTAEGSLLPGPSSQDKLALWVSGGKPCKYGAKCHDKSPEHRAQYTHPGEDGDQASSIMVVPRTADATKMKTVNFKNKKGVASTKSKQVHVQVDITRKLRWSVMPEQHHLVMLPRLLRTTHAHSPYFRVTGEDVRRLELEFGSETRTPLKGDRLIAYSPCLPYILGAAQGSWREDKFWALCQLLGCPLIDRTGKLACPIKFHVVHPIPPLGSDPGPLSDLMKARARHLLDKYLVESNNQGQSLQLLWSGGIDTTAVVCAFLLVAHEEEKKRLLVRYCSRSVKEYPKFFENVIRGQIPYKEIVGHVRDAFDEGPTVTGDPADMLMGTLVMGGAFKGRYSSGNKRNRLHFALEKPWHKVIPEWLCERGLLEKSKDATDEWLAWMNPFVKASPVEIVTVFDWLWWVTYACKYQHDLLRVFYNRSNVSEDVRRNVVNFFEAEEFHRWSFHHHHEKMPDKRVWASYKLPLKDFIFSHTGDAEYRAHKMKVQSVRNSWGFELGITNEWEIISFGRFSVSLRRMREKYERDLDRFLEAGTLQSRNERTTLANDYIVMEDRKIAGGVGLAAGFGILTLAAFNNAEVFDPSKARSVEEIKGGADSYMGE